MAPEKLNIFLKEPIVYFSKADTLKGVFRQGTSYCSDKKAYRYFRSKAFINDNVCLTNSTVPCNIVKVI